MSSCDNKNIVDVFMNANVDMENLMIYSAAFDWWTDELWSE